MPSLPFEPLLRPIPFVRDFGVARASEIRHSPVRCFAHSIRVLRHISHTPFTHYPAGAESLRPHFAPFTSGRTSRHLCLVLPRGSILLQCLGGSLAYQRKLRNWAGIPEPGGNSGTGWEFRNWTGILDLLQGLLKGGSFLVLACMESSKATQISLGLVGRPVYTGNDIPRFSSDGPSAWQMTLQNTSRTSRVYGG